MLTARQLHPAVIERCQEIYFRQSMINDFLVCPQMSLYRWVLGLEEDNPFLAGLLGSAGHAVIYNLQSAKDFQQSFEELIDAFTIAFNAELTKAAVLPNIPAGCESIEEAVDEKAPYYAALLRGYSQHERNQKFHSTIHEQSFVLEFPGTDAAGLSKPYLFTGTIDQGGYYDDGTFTMRDIKFRADNFKPNQTQLDLDIQITVYAAALKYGVPSCLNCRPKYCVEAATQRQTLTYDGPCPQCQKKLKTPAWPQKYAERCEIVWMRDFERYSKDEYLQHIKDPAKVKVANARNRMVIREILNPKWVTGYKRGDYKGEGLLKTTRTPAQIDVLMSDIVRICEQIRRGQFFRKPGEKCNFWCKFKENCIKGMELEVKELDYEKADHYATYDPFGD